MDEKGNIISPTEPNAYKFEAFIFDAFSSIPEMLVMRVKREEEFAPVKTQKELIVQKQQENYIKIILQITNERKKTKMEEYIQKYNKWLADPVIDEKSKKN